jgi:hypothetical protein
MLANVPTLAIAGVPDSCPLLLSKFAQLGWLTIEKVRVLPLAPEAVGVKL